MERIETAEALRERIGLWRRAGNRIALVPTMGNLHAGHLTLVDRARELAGRVVVSIFVNPTQFGPGEDFAVYPRTPDADCAALIERGVDVAFLPTVPVMYPTGVPGAVRVEVGGPLTAGLCGASRPGHFDGVATVVTKLFNLVQPDVAVFGEKDYQQLAVIRALVRELAMPIDIVGVPTRREADGLALSSRNQYLDPEQRARAPLIHAILSDSAAALMAGVRDHAAIEARATARLAAGGFSVEYVHIVRPDDLQAPQGRESRLVLLVAARLGSTRLIDNIEVKISE
ncbi:MAG: pantoate--beta-alanine ligase [Pseudomonadota bacterium]